MSKYIYRCRNKVLRRGETMKCGKASVSIHCESCEKANPYLNEGIGDSVKDWWSQRGKQRMEDIHWERHHGHGGYKYRAERCPLCREEWEKELGVRGIGGADMTHEELEARERNIKDAAEFEEEGDREDREFARRVRQGEEERGYWDGDAVYKREQERRQKERAETDKRIRQQERQRRIDWEIKHPDMSSEEFNS